MLSGALMSDILNQFGRGLFWAEGESHRRYVHSIYFGQRECDKLVRQRKSLTPAFSIAAIRKLTPIFYDSAHKVLSRFLRYPYSSHVSPLPMRPKQPGTRSLNRVVNMAPSLMCKTGAFLDNHCLCSRRFDTIVDCQG